jgi:hypothetical protein
MVANELPQIEALNPATLIKQIALPSDSTDSQTLANRGNTGAQATVATAVKAH